MSKNPKLLVDAYCDLIESKLTVISKSQRRFLNEINKIATTYMTTDHKLGLEDLYAKYGTPASVAKKLDAAMSDPERMNESIQSILSQSNIESSDDDVTLDVKVLTAEQSREILQKIIDGEDLSAADFEKFEDTDINDILHDINNKTSHDTIEDRIADIAATFERANEMADAGMDVDQIALLNGIPTMALYLGGFGEPANDIAGFIIPVKFQMQGFVKIKATSVDDAIMTANTFIDKIPTPRQATFIPDSLQICTDESMVSLYTDKYRRGKLTMTPTDTDIVTPLIDRDEMLERANPDHIMDTILSIMGIDVDELTAHDCNCSSGNNDTDNDEPDNVAVDIPCDSNNDCTESEPCAATEDDAPENIFFDDIEELPEECRPMDFEED